MGLAVRLDPLFVPTRCNLNIDNIWDIIVIYYLCMKNINNTYEIAK